MIRLPVAALMGVVTGTFGGVIRDVVCNRVPGLSRTAPLFATCSFVGCWSLFGLNALSVPWPVAVPSVITGIVLMRLAAIRWNWRLPQHHDEDAIGGS
ncbi:MAG: TRIC cation channel family protein [Fuerstiella sp.]